MGYVALKCQISCGRACQSRVSESVINAIAHDSIPAGSSWCQPGMASVLVSLELLASRIGYPSNEDKISSQCEGRYVGMVVFNNEINLVGFDMTLFDCSKSSLERKRVNVSSEDRHAVGRSNTYVD